MPRRPPAVARVLERVTATAREHEMFSPGDLVLAAVSGGPDSTCLLYSLWFLRRLFRIRPAAFHFNHRLRPDSAKDADYVRRLAARLGVPFHLRAAEDAPAKGDSVEDWAHRARGRALQGVLRSLAPATTATGHTIDDQAETVLIALLRGGSPDALAGMAPRWGPMVHPLIEVRRSEVRAFVRALGLRPRLDPSNRDTRLMRNALRLEGIPALERAVGRDVVEPIARSASLLQADSRYIWRAVMAAQVGDGGRGTLAVRPVLALDRAIASRLVRSELLLQMDDAPEEAHVAAVLDLAAGRPGRRRDLGGGLIAVRDREYVRLLRPSPGDRQLSQTPPRGDPNGRPTRSAARDARSRRVAR